MNVCKKHLPSTVVIFNSEICPICEIEKELELMYEERDGYRDDLERIKDEFYEDGFVPDDPQVKG